MRWLLALAVLTEALVPPHRPRPPRTRVYKLPQETVDLKFRAKGLLDDVKRNLEEGAEMPDSAEKLRKAYVTDVSGRRPLLLRRARIARWRRCDYVCAPPARRWRRGRTARTPSTRRAPAPARGERASPLAVPRDVAATPSYIDPRRETSTQSTRDAHPRHNPSTNAGAQRHLRGLPRVLHGPQA